MTEPRPRRPALLKAFLGSFAVYLLPVISPHVAMIWGMVVVMEVAMSGRREPLWLAADLALAVLLQATAFALLYWLFRRPAWWRIGILAATVPVFFCALLNGYMLVIPTYFLVERDTARAIGGWPVLCDLPHAWLDTLRSQFDTSSQMTMSLWVARGDGSEHAILDMPGCAVRPEPKLSLTGGSAIDHVTPAGDVLYRLYDKDSERFEYHFLAHDANDAQSLAAPANMAQVQYWAPVLSVDGTAIAWLDRITLADGTRQQVVWTRDVASGIEEKYDTGRPPAEQLELLYYDSRNGEFLFSRYPNEAFAIDRTSRATWGPLRFDGIESVGRNIRRVAGGWIAWDAYREAGRYRIAWSLPGGSGVRDVPKGRGINSVSATVTGDLIAVSLSSIVSIGGIQDAVIVFRTSDGSEVLRRYLPPYTRTPIQFLGGRYLAISTIENGKGQVVVMQVLR